MAQITEASLRETLTEKLQAVHVEITDISGGCGQAFTALIVSPQFKGLTSLKRHRLVNATLKEEIAAIHAWTAKCRTPEEWERDKASASAGSESADAARPPTEGTVDGQVEGTRG